MVFRVSLLAVGLLTSAPPVVWAQCVVEGVAEVRDVSVPGADMRFGVAERARISLEGSRASVQGITPIAFEGRARSRDVALHLSGDRTLRGVLLAGAGTPVHVVGATAQRVAAWVDAGPARVTVSLGCGDLSLSDAASDDVASAAAEAENARRVVRFRGRVLRAYATPEGGAAVELRLRAGLDLASWPDLTVIGSRGSRVRVRSELDDGVVLNAWVERDTVRSAELSSSSSCGCDGPGPTGCGHGYSGETYRGPARIAAGTELRDAEGQVWGRVVVESSLEVAVTSYTSGVQLANGRPFTERVETVWVESIPGLVADPCRGLAAQVDRDTVTLPEHMP